MAGEGIEVRPLAPADLPRVRELLFDRRLWVPLGLVPPLRAATDDYLAPWLRGPRAAAVYRVAAEADAGVVGCGRVYEGRLDYFVDPDRWGRGIGHQLAAALCVAAFADLGLARLTAAVVAGNTPSGRILERLGFAPAGTDRDRDGRRLCEYRRDRGSEGGHHHEGAR